MLRASCSHEILQNPDEDLTFETCGSTKELLPLLQGSGIVNLIYCEVRGAEDQEILEKLRAAQPDAAIGVITSAAVSPLVYLRPKIAPKLLLLRPLDAGTLARANHEFFESVPSLQKEEADAVSFLLRTREEKLRIPYGRIDFFEAVNKKICIRVGKKEYDFYGSIENIAGETPGYFVRCHRSYIVNRNRIVALYRAENLLELEDGTKIPVSRSYRKELMEKLEGIRWE